MAIRNKISKLPPQNFKAQKFKGKTQGLTNHEENKGRFRFSGAVRSEAFRKRKIHKTQSPDNKAKAEHPYTHSAQERGGGLF